ncbi:MAG: FAD-dependent oxidoreductase, partial [Actinomycetes bacterium]
MSQGPVIIVGAGLAGLRCANVLSDAGVDIVVLERGRHVGGRVITDDVDGFKIDRGFQLLNPSYPQVERGLDLKDLDLQAFDPGMVLSDGVTHSQVADPLRSPGKILATLRAPLGPLTSRLQLARLLLALKGKQRKPVTINPDQPSAAWMLEKGIDRTTIDALLRPFLAGVLLED